MFRFGLSRGREKAVLRTVGIALSISFAVLLLFFSINAIIIARFNSTNNGVVKLGDEEGTVLFDMGFRGGSTDSWERNTIIKGKNHHLYACIYEVRVKNDDEHMIKDWSFTIKIHQDCYLNNAWNGDFEVHQFVDGSENVQTLNLQTVDPPSIKLKSFYEGQDLMIPLTEGDYIIYHPSHESMEYPLVGYFDKTYIDKPTIMGYIMYYEGPAFDYSDSYMNYHFYQDVFSSSQTVVCRVLFVIWLFVFAIYATFIIANRLNERRLQQGRMFINSAMSVFTNFFDAKDPYTRGHSGRVGEISKLLAEKLGLDEEQCQTIHYVAFMHDCGKCYISDSILKKEGKLSDEEYEVIKTHTVKGGEMVEEFTAIDGLKDGILYHHERYDGKGYPEGLAGTDIPLIARIIGVADAYDAMSSDRCYRTKLSKEKIVQEIQNNKGKQFDPEIADIMLQLINDNLV